MRRQWIGSDGETCHTPTKSADGCKEGQLIIYLRNVKQVHRSKIRMDLITFILSRVLTFVMESSTKKSAAPGIKRRHRVLVLPIWNKGRVAHISESQCFLCGLGYRLTLEATDGKELGSRQIRMESHIPTVLFQGFPSFVLRDSPPPFFYTWPYRLTMQSPIAAVLVAKKEWSSFEMLQGLNIQQTKKNNTTVNQRNGIAWVIGLAGRSERTVASQAGSVGEANSHHHDVGNFFGMLCCESESQKKLIIVSAASICTSIRLNARSSALTH